jgi:hypothetical protein
MNNNSIIFQMKLQMKYNLFIDNNQILKKITFLIIKIFQIYQIILIFLPIIQLMLHLLDWVMLILAIKEVKQVFLRLINRMIVQLHLQMIILLNLENLR